MCNFRWGNLWSIVRHHVTFYESEKSKLCFSFQWLHNVVAGQPLTAKRSKNSVLDNDLLLCSSKTVYILTAFSLWSAGYTLTKHILEHDLELTGSPQISVHSEVTAGVALFLCSPPWSSLAVEFSVFHGACPGCNADGCLSLFHSLHCTAVSQSFARCLVEAQHLKQMCLSLIFSEGEACCVMDTVCLGPQLSFLRDEPGYLQTEMKLLSSVRTLEFCVLCCASLMVFQSMWCLNLLCLWRWSLDHCESSIAMWRRDPLFLWLGLSCSQSFYSSALTMCKLHSLADTLHSSN